MAAFSQQKTVMNLSLAVAVLLLAGKVIAAAAGLIIYEAGNQFYKGVEISNLSLGLWITAGAALTNLILGLSLVKVGNRTSSPLLRANGMHVLTDVWSSAAVLLALVLIKTTGWVWWDPIAAILAALNIFRVGLKLIRESMRGLLDEADPVIEQQARDTLDQETAARNLGYHNFRHRHSGRSHWVEFHLIFPDEMTVEDAHNQATEIESTVAKLIAPDGRVITHLEPRSSEQRIEDWEKP